MHEIDQRDRELLAALQGEIPLISTPYAGIGQIIEMSEKEVLKRAERLKRVGMIKQISAIFDSRALGFRSSLVAARVAEDAVERAASIINLHPGVTQNYLRNHAFNLWFTIAVAPESRLGLERTIQLLGDDAGCDVVRSLPTLRSFKSGGGEEGEPPPRDPLTPREVEVVRILQKDTPLQTRPFEALAKLYDFPADEMLATARELRARGQLKRLTAIAQMKRQSFSASAMGVWAVPEGRAEEVGQALASHKAIKQCFLRPTHDDWPYNIFTTVQSRSVDECESLLNEIASELDVREMRVLFPVKEYKRGKLQFFSPEFDKWEAEKTSEYRSASVAS